MAGPTKPPKEGSREQLERDNQTYVYADKPLSEQGGTVGEADADIPGLDDAIEAAMLDADPEAYKQGLREDATISSSRVFAAGSLIAALGRDNATPQTHSEPTNQASDYSPYGHDEDLQTRIGNEHMAGSADGKIAGTIGAERSHEYYLEEKRREEDRMAAYVAAQAHQEAADAWKYATMSFEEFEEASNRVADRADSFVQSATAVNTRVSTFIDQDRQHAEREQQVVIEAQRQRQLLSRQLENETDPRTRQILEARIGAVDSAIAGVNQNIRIINGYTDEQGVRHEGRRETFMRYLEANETAIQYANLGKQETQQNLDNLRNMTGDQAKAEYISHLQDRIAQARENMANGQGSREDNERLIREAERRLGQLETMSGDEAKAAFQRRLEQRLGKFDERLGELQSRSEALDNARDSLARYRDASNEFANHMLELSQTENPTQQQLDRAAELQAQLRSADQQSRADLAYLNNQTRLLAQSHAADAADVNMSSQQAQVSASASDVDRDAARMGDDLIQIQARASIVQNIAESAARQRLRVESGTDTPDEGPRYRPTATQEETQASIDRAVGVLAAAKQEGRDLTREEFRELSNLPGLSWKVVRETAEDIGVQAPTREEMGYTGPRTTDGATASGPGQYGGDGYRGGFNDLEFRLFGYAPYSATTVPYSPIQPAGYSETPQVSDNFGISGGAYSSFADNEFNDTNPTIAETGGVTPSYSKPWYETAWDATSSFMSSVWSGIDTKPANPTANPLGQQPGVMLASADPNANRITPVAGTGAGGGAMA